MNTRSTATDALAITTMLLLTPPLMAEDDKAHAPDLDCTDPVGAGPAAMHEILGGLYEKEGTAEDLKAATLKLNELVNAATYCRVHIQSPESEHYHHLSSDWVALHQWVIRIADLMAQNADGDFRVHWRDEYVTFAELFEFKL